MLSFKKFLEKVIVEAKELTHSAISHKRSTMPQISMTDRKDLFKWLKTKGIRVSNITLAVTQVKPTQSKIDRKKVDKLAKIVDVRTEKFLISSDNFLIDGHHRFYALRDNGETKVNCVKIHVSIAAIIEILFEFDKTFTRK